MTDKVHYPSQRIVSAKSYRNILREIRVRPWSIGQASANGCGAESANEKRCASGKLGLRFAQLVILCVHADNGELHAELSIDCPKSPWRASVLE